ncbi:MAG: hypothetical protein A2087_04530 [Spirochaetes bacterium GWD1_61_31]|nr:MAG: hypothetical protein A2Y37_06415 [Spirochaetes bacterium GWB1_60_80]OHD33454.1 MAG: hypothetical protein A2004_06220 [Spirochaetes bacterium GWC1_61_12]OHD40584.1 MAG: hypothetical protein A2087_04530 [Spirochaetes bacterium GWD1_61_31]OHD59285.1 MAG: hypothetical protein A2Y32_09805 [Spirochaetes bacterium GWF1_60_12]HAP44579.1 hypothetical protein [Spirochaetaceae bacterium]
MERLYYDQPELAEVEAVITAAASVDGGRWALELDRQLFYPAGGGQPADGGSIDGRELLAVETAAADRIVHYVADPGARSAVWQPGRKVLCRLNLARRLDHSCQHSAQHLLSATVLRLLDGPTRSFHLGEDYCSIDVALESLSSDDANLVEAEVQRLIDADYRLTTHVCQPGEVEKFTLRRRPPTGEEVLRIVEIDGYDFTPCCGTHMASTAALRLFRLLRHEKYKGMTRLYFLAGQRALTNYRRLAETARSAAARLGCAELDLATEAGRLVDKARALESNLSALALAAAELRAGALLNLAAAAPCTILDWPTSSAAAPAEASHGVADGAAASPLLVLARLDGLDLSQCQATAKACAAHGCLAALLCRDATTLVCAGNAPSWQLGRRLSPLLPAVGGKGGGGPMSFQVAFPDLATAEAFLQRLPALFAPP